MRWGGALLGQPAPVSGKPESLTGLQLNLSRALGELDSGFRLGATPLVASGVARLQEISYSLTRVRFTGKTARQLFYQDPSSGRLLRFPPPG